MKFGRFLLTFAHPLFRFLFPYTIRGIENIPKQDSGIPVMLCSNHISNIDPVFLLMVQKRPIYYMAKAELFPNKLAVWFFKKEFGAFPVNRGKGDTTAIETAQSIVRSGKMLGIFPEGTRSKDGKMLRPKSGAALIASRTGAYILPVAIFNKRHKVRVFHRTTIVIGKLMSPAELHLDDSEHPDIRFASRHIMERISELMEANL